jgi:hypothetical protein
MRIDLKCVATVAAMCLAIGSVAVPTQAQKKGTSQPTSPSSSPAASPSSSPSTGSATSGPFEEQVLAYGSLEQIFGKLAPYACGVATQKNANGILVLDSATLQALQAFDSFYTNAEALSIAFRKMAAKSGAGAAGIDAFADITSAVATAATASNTETSSSFTISDPSAALVLLGQMQKIKGCPAQLYGGVYSVGAGGVKVGGKTLNSVETEIESLAQDRIDALKAVHPIDANGKVQANPTVPCQATPTPTGSGTNTVLAVGSQDACIAAFNTLDATYNALLTNLSSTNASTGQPALTSVLQGYRLRELFAEASAAAPKLGVYVNVAAAAGTQQDRKNLLTNLFTGDFIRYSGGVCVNTIVFLIASENSSILYSDLLRYRTPLKQIGKPKNYDGKPNAGDNLYSIPATTTQGPGSQ